jgi:hypothetical protein
MALLLYRQGCGNQYGGFHCDSLWYVYMYGGGCLNSHGDSQSQRQQHMEIFHTIRYALLFQLLDKARKELVFSETEP